MDVARFDRSDTDVRAVYDRLVLSVKHQPLKGSVMFSGCARVVASGFALYGFPVAFAYSSFFFFILFADEGKVSGSECVTISCPSKLE